MRLVSIRMQNFRAFEDETVYLDNYSCMVGANGAGKSTILAALNVFFRETRSSTTDVITLSKEDFHRQCTDKPVEITLAFDELTSEAQVDLKDYYRQGQVVFTAKAIWNETSQSAPVSQHGERKVMKVFAPYFEAKKEKKSAAELGAVYEKLREVVSELPKASSGPKREAALQEYEESNPDLCELSQSPDQLYGFTKGTDRISKYVQWVYVPAVKDASSEQDESKNTALGTLLQRTIRAKVDFRKMLDPLRKQTGDEYEVLIAGKQGELADLSGRLEKRLRHWAHSGSQLSLKWQVDLAKQIRIDEPNAQVLAGERGFLGELSRLGHGMQRSFLVAILQELVAESDEAAPRLLLGIEEPELYQHPPQARHFATLLEKISEEGTQVIVTTHSPYFVSARGFEAIRMVRPLSDSGGASVNQMSSERLTESLDSALGTTSSQPADVMARLHQVLQPAQAEMFFCQVPIFVEGVEDVALISTCINLQNKWTDFHRLGCHLVVSGGKTNMSRLVAIATGLEMPAWAIFDCDGNSNGDDRKNNERDNACLLRLCGGDPENFFPADPVFGDNYACWPKAILPSVKKDVGEMLWNDTAQQVRDEYQLSGVNQKNQVLLAETLNRVWPQREPELLVTLCERILAYADGVGTTSLSRS